MIHMGSDHRCVMAIFAITMLGKNIQYKNTKKKHDTIEHQERDQAEKNIEVEKPELEKKPRDHFFFFKKKSRNKKCRSASRK